MLVSLSTQPSSYMLLTTLMTMTLLSISQYKNNHPMMMNILTIMLTLMITFMMNFNKYSMWYSSITFIIMIGGLMVMFLYFTSTTSNMITHHPETVWLKSSMKMMTVMMMLPSMNKMNIFKTNYKQNSTNMSLIPINDPSMNCMSMYYNSPIMTLLMILTLIYLMSMLSMMHSTKMLPLRQ